MLFCLPKNAKRVTAITMLVVVIHFFVVWVACLKIVVHHFSIPLSAQRNSIKIKLKKTVPVVKVQKDQVPQKPNTQKAAPITQKTPKTSVKKRAQKVPVQTPVNKPKNSPKKIHKTIETKKLPAKESQKTKDRANVEVAKKAPDTILVDDMHQQKINQAIKPAVSGEGIAQQGPVNSKVDYYEMVYETIIAQWRPPIGIAKGTSCTVSFAIDNKGMPVDIVLEKKSGVLMFDISIKTGLASITFSSLFVGNRFSIVFTV